VGLGGEVQAGVIAFGAAWVAGGHGVERVDLSNGHRKLIQMRPRVWAGGIAVDRRTQSISTNSGHRPPNT
jgi:hypothetical protein